MATSQNNTSSYGQGINSSTLGLAYRSKPSTPGSRPTSSGYVKPVAFSTELVEGKLSMGAPMPSNFVPTTNNATAVEIPSKEDREFAMGARLTYNVEILPEERRATIPRYSFPRGG